MLLNRAIFHSNRYHADATCRHCSGVIRHESWCVTRNTLVCYAYEAVVDPEKTDFRRPVDPACPRRQLDGQPLHGNLLHHLIRKHREPSLDFVLESDWPPPSRTPCAEGVATILPLKAPGKDQV
jgi:hypothetical protein